MKRITNPGAIVTYEGHLAKVVGISEGRTITLELLEVAACPTCGEGRRVNLLEHSPLFQEGVGPVETLSGADDDLAARLRANAIQGGTINFEDIET